MTQNVSMQDIEMVAIMINKLRTKSEDIRFIGKSSVWNKYGWERLNLIFKN